MSVVGSGCVGGRAGCVGGRAGCLGGRVCVCRWSGLCGRWSGLGVSSLAVLVVELWPTGGQVYPSVPAGDMVGRDAELYG